MASGGRTHRRRVLTPRTPSRDSLDEAAETSPRPKADWTPRRRLKFYGRRLADDSLSDNQIKRLREGLLGEYGLNWRRDRMLASGVTIAKFASNTSRRVVGQWGGAGGACCEDHLAFCGELLGLRRLARLEKPD